MGISMCKKGLRSGSVLIEVAMIIPIMVLIVAMAADVVGGVFRYHQIVTQAREAARYASVHAGTYAKETGQAIVTADQLKNSVILPSSAALEANLLTCQLTWLPNGDPYPYTTKADGSRKQNSVKVVLQYQWKPLFFFGSPLTLSSTSETPVTH
jgi:Flp pilus assembly protein TadG